MNIKQFRMLDLLFLTVLAVASKIAGTWLLKDVFTGAGFQMDFSLLISVIALVRWGKYALYIYPLCGVTEALVDARYSTLPDRLLIYVIGASFIVMTMLMFKFIKREKIGTNLWLVNILITIAYLATSVGTALMVFVLSDMNLVDVIRTRIGSQMFTLLAAYGVAYILYKKSEMFVDVETYFIQTRMEEEEDDRFKTTYT